MEVSVSWLYIYRPSISAHIFLYLGVMLMTSSFLNLIFLYHRDKILYNIYLCREKYRYIENFQAIELFQVLNRKFFLGQTECSGVALISKDVVF